MMPGKNLHALPFDEATLAKLRIFENYTQEWIPTFVMSGFPTMCIFDFFAGPGYDIAGVPGSPIRILRQIAEQRDIIFQKKPLVKFFLNEYDRDKYENLKIACEEYIKASSDLSALRKAGKIEIFYFNCSFSDVFKDLLPIIQREASLVLLDQNGVKFIADEYFFPLANTTKTDFLYFVASSYILRFKGTEEFKKYINFNFDDVKKGTFAHFHKYLLNQLKARIPKTSSIRLYPFSIKKGTNLYGIIFGSSHLRGVDKFLKTAWKENPENGEANFDIYDDELGECDLFSGPRLNKIEIFQKKIRQGILSGSIKNNIDAFEFSLNAGYLGKHASDEVKRMKEEGVINYSKRSPMISYEKCLGKERCIVNFELLGNN